MNWDEWPDGILSPDEVREIEGASTSVLPIPWWRRNLQARIAPNRYRQWVQGRLLAIILGGEP